LLLVILNFATLRLLLAGRPFHITWRIWSRIVAILHVVGRLGRKDRLKFETAVLALEEGQRKIKFARAWIEEGGSARPDLTSPLHRYVLGGLPPDKVVGVEEKLPCDENYRQRLDAAEDEVLVAYFHKTLPEHGRGLFDAHYLFNDRIVGKLRFAHIMYEYERASVAPSPTPENGVRASRRRLEKTSRRRLFHIFSFLSYCFRS
jgi:hypothetical protein